MSHWGIKQILFVQIPRTKAWDVTSIEEVQILREPHCEAPVSPFRRRSVYTWSQPFERTVTNETPLVSQTDSWSDIQAVSQTVR